MATATKSKRSKPPKQQARKDNPINAEYEDKAKTLLKYAMSQKSADYEALAANLHAIGVDISVKGLENKISRGGFSAAFLLQCMEALEINLTSLPR
jgi:uncharacterized protein DUF6471